MGDIGKQVTERAKQAAKQAGKKVKQAIWQAIAPALPYIAIGVAIFVMMVLIICMFENFSDEGLTTVDAAESEATGWWWPIGSAETTTSNGVLFASGEPVDMTITSGVGPRWGTSHNGIDIAPNGGGTPPGPYIIASRDGTVEYVIDGFEDNGNAADGGGFGNHIIINYGDGIKVTYGHLSKNTIKVNVGDSVTYGQVIAQMGHSGHSTAMHLHFEMRLNGTVVDPEEYVSQSDPRPVTEVEYSSTGVSKALLFVMEGENSALRGYLDGKYSYDYSPYIYNYITKDKQYYLMGNDLGLNCNGNYGFGICFFVENNYCKSNPSKGQMLNRSRTYRLFSKFILFSGERL